MVAKRPLGRSGLSIAPLGFGGNVFGWTADKRASFDLLDRCVAAGIDLIDTADVYSRFVPGNVGGESETVIGEWLAARGGRHRIVLATKCGNDMGPDGSGLSRAHILRSVDRSLARLRTDYIDLYQAHRDDPDTPLEETLSAFADLLRAGKVRAIGASNYSAARLAEALAVSARCGLPRFESLQPHYSLVARAEFEAELAGLCARENLGVLAYFSLASGFLTGKYRSAEDLGTAGRSSHVRRLLTDRNLAILAAVDTVAAEHGAKPSQVALAWLMARGVTAPLASATSVSQLDELLGSLSLRLNAADLARLDAVSNATAVPPS